MEADNDKQLGISIKKLVKGDQYLFDLREKLTTQEIKLSLLDQDSTEYKEGANQVKTLQATISALEDYRKILGID